SPRTEPPAAAPVEKMEPVMAKSVRKEPSPVHPFAALRGEGAAGGRAKEAPDAVAAPSPQREAMSAAAAAAPGAIAARSNPDGVWRLAGTSIEGSEDAGRTWQSQASGASAPLTAGSAPSAEVCWVVGRGGIVLRTSDGRHWERVSSPTKEDLVQVTAFA